MYMANPNMLENILRAEGRYPRRENTLSPNLEWILAKLKLPQPFAIKYVHIAIATRTKLVIISWFKSLVLVCQNSLW